MKTRRMVCLHQQDMEGIQRISTMSLLISILPIVTRTMMIFTDIKQKILTNLILHSLYNPVIKEKINLLLKDNCNSKTHSLYFLMTVGRKIGRRTGYMTSRIERIMMMQDINSNTLKKFKESSNQKSMTIKNITNQLQERSQIINLLLIKLPQESLQFQIY